MFLKRTALSILASVFAVPVISADFSSVYKSVVKITVETTRGGRVNAKGMVEKSFQYGTGFFVGPDGTIATANHVVEDKSPNLDNPIECIELETNIKFRAIVVYQDKIRDIALLRKPIGPVPGYINVSKGYRQSLPGNLYCLGVPNEIRTRSNALAVSRARLLKERTDIDVTIGLGAMKSVILVECDVWAGFSGGLIIGNDFGIVGMIIGSVEGRGKPQCFARRIDDIIAVMDAEHGPKH